MEALVALGLASNIVQFVSFAQSLIVTSKQISRHADGALVEYLELEAITQNLDRLSSSLLVKPDFSRLESQEDQELKELCEGCRDVAKVLVAKLNSLKVDSKTSGRMRRQWASFRQALKSVMSAREVADMEARLDRYQRAINSALLASLRAQVNEAEKEAEKCRKDREDRMSEVLLGFIDETKIWQADLVDTLHQNKWQPGSTHDVQLLARQLEHGAHIDRESLYKQQIYHLLMFEDIAEREITIAEAHKKTFDWIFQPGRSRIKAEPFSGDLHTPPVGIEHSSFTDWLAGNQNIYWITGKPGSGKSTLMKYLFHDERTLDSVSPWSGASELLTAGFFFWNSGTSMQMSRMGLLQTLLHGCLKGRTELVPSIFPVRPWTWPELSSALKKLISMTQFSFLLFIDGLDEFDGDPTTIATLVLELVEISPGSVKLCVASRPWLVFEETFRQMSWLRMEDLTRPDIRVYIEDSMQASRRWRDLCDFMPEESTKIITEILDKAVGVFLWVVLVVASLLGGLRDGDSIADLWVRLNELPSALGDLFKNILDRVNPEYFVQACELFKLKLAAAEPLTLLQASFAHDGTALAIDASVGQLPEDELSYRAETMRRRIMSRCKGLLESPKIHIDRECARVEYLHRTVRDFFKSPDALAYIQSGAPDYDASLFLAASSLRSTKVAPYRDTSRGLNVFWHSAMRCVEYARHCGTSNVSVSISILDALGTAGDVYWDRSSLQDSNDFTTGLASTNSMSTSWTWDRLVRDDQVDVVTSSAARPGLHWTNTIHVAHTDVVSSLDDLKNAAKYHRMASFFDFALTSNLNFYVSAKLTDRIAQEGIIRMFTTRAHQHPENHTILCFSVTQGNFALVPTLLECGANPNTLCCHSQTAWDHLLQKARLYTYAKFNGEFSRMAALYVRHGADLNLVLLEDFDAVFVDKYMDQVEREVLLGKVKVLKAPPVPTKPGSRGSRKNIWKKYKPWSSSKGGPLG